MVQIESKSIVSAIAKIRREYSHLSGDQLSQAISRALNRTASMGRTEASKNIRLKYNISASKINTELKVRQTSRRGLTAYIVANGEPLSLTNFQAKQEFERGTTTFNGRGSAITRITRKARTNAIKGVSAVIKKGETINLPTAFIQVANGGITVFARGKYKGKGEGFEFGKPRLPIGKITTTSIPLMFAADDVMKPTQSRAEEILSDRITHEIKWLLGR